MIVRFIRSTWPLVHGWFGLVIWAGVLLFNAIIPLGYKGLMRLFPIVIRKAERKRGGARLSSCFAANMNEWQKLGTQNEAANDRKWVIGSAA